MAAVSVNANIPASSGMSLTTALQELTPAREVAFIDFVADVACYVVISASGSDGGAIGSLPRFLVPANTIYPIPVQGLPIFVATVTSTGNGFAMGVDRG